MKLIFKPLFSTAGRAIRKRAPLIMVGVAVGTSVSACIETARATVKAVEDVKKAEEEKGETLSSKEIVKVTWKRYIEPAVLLGISATCCIGSHRLHAKRGAVLAAEYASAMTALDNYKAKAKEIVGEEKQNDISAAVAETDIKRKPPTEMNIFDAKGGDALFFDMISARYFRSDKQTVREIINDLNQRLMFEHYISVNEFYYDLGLDGIGVDLGWNIDTGLIDVTIGTSEAPGDIPCYTIDYLVRPRYENYY